MLALAVVVVVKDGSVWNPSPYWKILHRHKATTVNETGQEQLIINSTSFWEVRTNLRACPCGLFHQRNMHVQWILSWLLYRIDRCSPFFDRFLSRLLI